MNYRHGFHAGNHADVLKHAVLALCLTAMSRKAKPLVAVDAFGGAGRYDLLLDDRAARTGEWREGVARIWAARATAPTELEPFLELLRAENEGGELRFYPGSPLVAQRLLGPEDKLLAVELHEDEAAALIRDLDGDRRARVYTQDGWAALRSFLPPTPRRGVVLIDPPFERPGEFDRMVAAARDGLRRWATGVFLFWHPIKDLDACARYAEDLCAVAGDTPLLSLDLLVKDPSEGGLIGSGLMILNPPFGLAEETARLGPWLAEQLDQGGGAFAQEWRVAPR